MRGEHQKKDVLMRLKRIEGQLRGIQKMVEQNTPCSDVLTQMAAATAGMKRAGMVMVQTYMEECINTTREEPVARREEVMKDFQKTLSRYIDWA